MCAITVQRRLVWTRAAWTWVVVPRRWCVSGVWDLRILLFKKWVGHQACPIHDVHWLEKCLDGACLALWEEDQGLAFGAGEAVLILNITWCSQKHWGYSEVVDMWFQECWRCRAGFLLHTSDSKWFDTELLDSKLFGSKWPLILHTRHSFEQSMLREFC
jgi:hypothetical protein